MADQQLQNPPEFYNEEEIPHGGGPDNHPQPDDYDQEPPAEFGFDDHDYAHREDQDEQAMEAEPFAHAPNQAGRRRRGEDAAAPSNRSSSSSTSFVPDYTVRRVLFRLQHRSREQHRLIHIGILLAIGILLLLAFVLFLDIGQLLLRPCQQSVSLSNDGSGGLAGRRGFEPWAPVLHRHTNA